MALVSLLDAQPWYAIMARENRVRLIRLSILGVRGVVRVPAKHRDNRQR